MKSQILSLFLSTALLLLASVTIAEAQERGNDSPRVSPNASVSQTIGTTTVTITYGRPSVRDRAIFGGLVPYRQVWRSGANESTAITFSDRVTIEGQSVEAGTYSLYTIPDRNEWTIILNELLSWGTRYDETQDLLRVRVEPDQASHQEQFLITFRNVTEDSAELILHWDRVRVPVRIGVE